MSASNKSNGLRTTKKKTQEKKLLSLYFENEIKVLKQPKREGDKVKKSSSFSWKFETYLATLTL